jgi:hypothetical protein
MYPLSTCVPSRAVHACISTDADAMAARLVTSRQGWKYCLLSWREIGVERKPLRRAIGQELLDEIATVNGGAVPDDDHAVGGLAQQGFETHHTSPKLLVRSRPWKYAYPPGKSR